MPTASSPFKPWLKPETILDVRQMSQYENDNPLRFVITFGCRLHSSHKDNKDKVRWWQWQRQLLMPTTKNTTTTTTTMALTIWESHDIYFNDILKASPIKYDHLNCCQTQHKIDIKTNKKKTATENDHKNY